MDRRDATTTASRAGWGGEVRYLGEIANPPEAT